MRGNWFHSLNVVLLVYLLRIPTSGQLVYSNGTVQCGAHIEESIQNDTECDWKLGDNYVFSIYSNMLFKSFVNSAAECLESVRQQCPWANIAAVGNAGDCWCVYEDDVTMDSSIQSNDTSFVDDTSSFSCLFRDHDWNTMNFVYDCPGNYDINRYLDYTVCYDFFGFNYEDISPTLDAYTVLTDLGLGYINECFGRFVCGSRSPPIR